MEIFKVLVIRYEKFKTLQVVSGKSEEIKLLKISNSKP